MPQVPILAQPRALQLDQVVDGIKCELAEKVVFHIHAHLAIFVDGAARGIPEGVGIAPPRQEVSTSAGQYVTGGMCFYWLHTHTADGILHIESPAVQTFTLGQFFDIWGQTLSDSQVGPASGTVTAYVNGKEYQGLPTAIPLTDHAVIQLDVGTKVSPKAYTFAPGYA